MSPVDPFPIATKMVCALRNSINQFPLWNSTGDDSDLQTLTTNSLWRFLAVALLTNKAASFNQVWRGRGRAVVDTQPREGLIEWIPAAINKGRSAASKQAVVVSSDAGCAVDILSLYHPSHRCPMRIGGMHWILDSQTIQFA
jgi:hypothetical protein